MHKTPKNPAVEAYLNNTRAQKESKSAMEMGLSSISKMLENIYNKTEEGVKLLDVLCQKNGAKTDDIITDTNKSLLSFSEREDGFNNKKKKKDVELKEDDLVTNVDKYQEENIDYTSHLIDIKNILQEILEKDNPSKKDKKNKKEKEKPDKTKKLKGVEKIKNIEENTDNLSKFSKAIERMHDAFNHKLNRSLKIFTRLMQRMFDKKFQVSLKVTAASMNVLTTQLKSFSDTMKESVFNMKNFMKMIWLISLSLISPMFMGALASMEKFFKVLNSGISAKKEERKNKTYNSLLYISFGILALVGALLLVKYVSWKDLAMALGFLTALGLILRLFVPKNGINVTKTITQNSNNISGYTNGGMLGMIAIGLAILVLTIAALAEVNWVPCLTLVAFILALYTVIAIGNKMTKGGNAMGGLPGFAFGLSLLVLVIVALGELTKQEWIAAGFLVGFMFAVSLAVRLAGGGIKGMFGFAVGITLLILCVVALGEITWKEWKAAAFLVAFIYGISLAIRNATSGKQVDMKKFALSFLFVVTVTVLAIFILNKSGKGSYVNVAMFITMIASITLLYYFVWKKMGRMKSFDKIDGYVKAMMKSMMFVALSVMIMSIFKPNFNTVLLLLSTVVSITMMYYVVGTKMKDIDFETVDEQIKGMIKNLLFISISVMLMSIFKPNFNTIILLITSMVAIASLYYFVDKLFKQMNFERTDMIVKSMAVSLLLISAALFIVGNSNINWKLFGILTLTIVSIVAIYAIVGIPAVASLVTLGSVVMLLAATSMLFIGITLSILSYIPINTKGINNFKESILSITKTLAGLLLYAPFALLASVMLLPVALVSILLATTLLILSYINIDQKKITDYNNSLNSIIMNYNEIGLIKAAKVLAISIILLPVATLSLLFVGILKVISMININKNQIDVFGNSIYSIVNYYDKIGFKKSLKASATSVLLLPLVTTGLLYAKLLQEIGNTKISESQIDTFTKSLSMFIQSFSDEIIGTVGKMKKMGPGLKSLAQLVSISKGFADIVLEMSNLRYNEYEVKDGKLVLKSVRKVTDDDIKKVGINVGKLLGALIQPISIINSDSEYFDFGGGIRVVNPFKKGWFGNKNKGADRISQIGNAYKSVFDGIKTINDSVGMLSDTNLMKSVNMSISSYLDNTMMIFTKLSKNPIPNQERFAALNSMNSFMTGFSINKEFMNSNMEKYNFNVYDYFDTLAKSMERIDSKNFSGGSTINDMTAFVDRFDSFKWNNLNKGLRDANNGLSGIKNNINGIDLQKAILFKQTLEYMTKDTALKGITLLVEKLNELISGIVIYQEKQELTQKNTEKALSTVADNTKMQNEIQEKIKNSNGKPLTMEDASLLFESLFGKLDNTTIKILQNRFKVYQTDAMGNEIKKQP